MALDEPHPTPRPQDPFTAQDAAKAFASLTSELRSINATLANILSKQISTLEQLSRIEESSSGSRIARLEQEAREAELDRDLAEAALRKAEERLQAKSALKEGSIDTEERLHKLAKTSLEDLERQKRADRESKIADLKFSALKAVITWGAVGIVGIILAFIWYFVRIYITGSP